MTIILLFCILLSFVAGGFVAYKGVQLGLRWQVEVRQERPPTMESPLANIAELSRREMHLSKKGDEEVKNLVSEWLNGADNNAK